MASCSQDGSLAIWIPSITGESTFWKGHTAAVRSVAFTPDGKQVVSASDDKTIKLWTVNRSKYHFLTYNLIYLYGVCNYMPLFLLGLFHLSLITQIGFAVFDLHLMAIN